MKKKRILYLGTDPSRYDREVVHCPLIETRPLPLPGIIQDEWDIFTHLILTSPNAVRILVSQKSLHNKKILAIGQGTAEGLNCFAVASPETQEGMIELLKTLELKDSYILYPKSASARPLLAEYLQEAGLKHVICDLYETVYLRPQINLDEFDEIVFTSPSTVKSFLEIYGSIPKNKVITCIGPITEKFLINKY